MRPKAKTTTGRSIWPNKPQDPSNEARREPDPTEADKKNCTTIGARSPFARAVDSLPLHVRDSAFEAKGRCDGFEPATLRFTNNKKGAFSWREDACLH